MVAWWLVWGLHYPSCIGDYHNSRRGNPEKKQPVQWNDRDILNTAHLGFPKSWGNPQSSPLVSIQCKTVWLGWLDDNLGTPHDLRNLNRYTGTSKKDEQGMINGWFMDNSWIIHVRYWTHSVVGFVNKTGIVMGMETINYRDFMEFLTIKDMEYTLWQTNIANWKITIYSWVNQLFLWPFSIVMSSYQRVYPSKSHERSHEFTGKVTIFKPIKVDQGVLII